jgi:hypothetical protein
MFRGIASCIPCLAAAAVAGAYQASAASHTCTSPPGVKAVRIAVDLNGQKSEFSGGYCQALGQALAAVGRSGGGGNDQAATTKVLTELVASGGGSAMVPTSAPVGVYHYRVVVIDESGNVGN